VIEERPQLVFRARFAARLTAIDPEAFLIRWGDTLYLSRLRIAGVPIVLTSERDAGGTFHSAIRTSVPAAIPTFEVRPETVLSGIGRAVGIVRDVIVGDPSFDALYVVDGPPCITALFTPDVRAALVSLHPRSPRISVADGVVEARWTGAEAEHVAPDEALAFALGVRAAIERHGGASH